MTFAELLAQLTAALQHPLPGPDAQARMAPQPRGGWPAGYSQEQLRHAAGLLLLYPVDNHAHLVLTVRSTTVRHAGQVSLPGGVIEPGETVERAALREAREEIACATDEVRILGRLSTVDIAVSGFRLHPVVGVMDQRPHLIPSDHEVARIVEVPVSSLLDPGTLARRTMQRGAMTMDVPAYVTHDLVIWGATAMVLSEFLALVG